MLVDPLIIIITVIAVFVRMRWVDGSAIQQPPLDVRPVVQLAGAEAKGRRGGEPLLRLGAAAEEPTLVPFAMIRTTIIAVVLRLRWKDGGAVLQLVLFVYLLLQLAGAEAQGQRHGEPLLQLRPAVEEPLLANPVIIAVTISIITVFAGLREDGNTVQQLLLDGCSALQLAGAEAQGRRGSGPSSAAVETARLVWSGLWCFGRGVM